MYDEFKGGNSMKIEKISDTQVKFILSEDDLADKDLKLEDLTVSTDKTRELFQEILAQALDECGFAIDDAPLMVEALPVALDSIMIIVTKLNDETASKQPAKNSVPPIISKDLHRYKRNPIKIHSTENAEDTSILIYSFNTLDDVIDACVRLGDMEITSSSVYKYNKKYYLVITTDADPNFNHLCALNEFGQKETSNILSKYHLVEHGETLISDNAVVVLSENFS